MGGNRTFMISRGCGSYDDVVLVGWVVTAFYFTCMVIKVIILNECCFIIGNLLLFFFFVVVVVVVVVDVCDLTHYYFEVFCWSTPQGGAKMVC